MKIAVWHNLPSGGGKRALYHHVKGLVERGHTLEAWCPPTADRTFLPLSDWIPEHVVPLDWKPVLLRRYVAGIQFYKNSMDLIRATDRHCQICAQQMNQGAYDILFANSCQFTGAAPIGRYFRGPKTIYLEEPNRSLYEAQPQLPWIAPGPLDNWQRILSHFKYLVSDSLRTWLYRVQAREELQSVRVFDAILVNSLYSRETALRVYGLDAKVCYLGVDPKFFKPEHTPLEDYVVGVGAFLLSKNIPFVIEALAHTSKPSPRLIWVGNFAYPGYVEQLQNLAAARGVRFEPHVNVSDQGLIDILNRAIAMVYAPRLEPFGFAPLEASACGLPVIAVAEGGVRETVVDGLNGLLVKSDPATMGQAIDRLRNDHDYARQLGENGRRWVEERWSWDAAVSRLEEHLMRVVKAYSTRHPQAS